MEVRSCVELLSAVCILTSRGHIQALIAPRSEHIVEATHCIMFFGAPHKGLETADFEMMAANVRGVHGKQKLDLIKNLRTEAESLQTRLEYFRDIPRRKGYKNLHICSFYEKLQSPVFRPGVLSN